MRQGRFGEKKDGWTVAEVLSCVWALLRQLLDTPGFQVLVSKVRLKKFGPLRYRWQPPRHIVQLILLHLVVPLAVVTQTTLSDHVELLHPRRCLVNWGFADKGVPLHVDALEGL